MQRFDIKVILFVMELIVLQNYANLNFNKIPAKALGKVILFIGAERIET